MARRTFTVKDGPLQGEMYALEGKHGQEFSFSLADGRTAIYVARVVAGGPPPHLVSMGLDPFA